jgi:ABC-type sugar transport system substrate-binding protein
MLWEARNITVVVRNSSGTSTAAAARSARARLRDVTVMGWDGSPDLPSDRPENSFISFLLSF